MLKTLPSVVAPHKLNRLKCGEVYYNTPSDYSVSCTFCNRKVKFIDFQKHFRKLHLKELEKRNQVVMSNEPWVAMAPASAAEEDPFKPEANENELQIEMLVDVDTELFKVQELEIQRKAPKVKNEVSFIDDETPIDIIEVKWAGSKGRRITRADTTTLAKSIKRTEELDSSEDFPEVEIKIESEFGPEVSQNATTVDDKVQTEPNDDDDLFEEDDNLQLDYSDADSDGDYEANSSSCSETAVVKEESTPSPYACKECDRSFRTNKGLQRHTTSTHKKNANQGNAKVTIKNDPAASEAELNAAVIKTKATLTKKKKKGVKRERPFKCDKCGETFTEDKQLQYHDMRKHTGIICDICGQSFSQIGNMQRHKIRHTGRKDFQCKECDKTFFTDKELAAHMLRHTQIWPHICDICGKRCRDGGVLTIHMRRHTGERPYKCNVCNKGFYEGHDRNIHQLSHFNDRPFTCDVCGSSFRHKKALRVHKKIHSTERNHVCKICAKGFAQSAGLVAHMRSHAAFVGQIDAEARMPVLVKGANSILPLPVVDLLSPMEASYESKSELHGDNEQSINGVF